MAFARKQDTTQAKIDAQARYEADVAAAEAYIEEHGQNELTPIEDTDTTESLLAQRAEIEGGEGAETPAQKLLAKYNEAYGVMLTGNQALQTHDFLTFALREMSGGASKPKDEEPVGGYFVASTRSLEDLWEFPNTSDGDRYARRVRASARQRLAKTPKENELERLALAGLIRTVTRRDSVATTRARVHVFLTADIALRRDVPYSAVNLVPLSEVDEG